MKTKVYLFLTIFSLLTLIFVSCEKDNEDPIIDPTEVPTYTLQTEVIGEGGTITPANITADSGSIVSLNINPENIGYDLDSLTINGISVFDEVVKSTSSSSVPSYRYDITLNSNSMVKATFKENLKGLFMNGEWVEDSIKLCTDNNNPVWTHIKVRGVPGEPQWLYTYLPNGRVHVYNETSVLIGDVPWSLDETKNPPVLHTGMSEDFPEGSVAVVEKLDENSMILANYNAECIGCLDPNVRGTIIVYLSH